MFAVGEYVIYGDSDLCRVEQIGVPQLHAANPVQRDYYFLSPVFYKGMIYAPIDTPVAMRPVIGREEALALIDGLPALEANPLFTSDRKKLSDHYNALLAPHTCESLAHAAKSIYKKYHGAAATPRGKLPNATEATIFKKVTELLLQELSVALDEPIEAVQARIETACPEAAPIKWSL